MTIISVYNGSGCVGRCDARCHQADTPACHCICGGRYHGRGSSHAAQDAVTEDWAPLVEAYAKQNGLDPHTLTFKTTRARKPSPLRLDTAEQPTLW